jgi:Restriction Endonuclease associating with ARP
METHLAAYKKHVLGTDQSGAWGGRPNGKTYPHILAADEFRLNIVDSARGEFWNYVESVEETAVRLKLHRDFRHLNSSQALAFNLFFPFLSGSGTDRNSLLLALGLTEEPIRDWQFEKVIDPKEKTNFDVWFQLSSLKQVGIEVKLTERHFGAAVPNPHRLDKLENLYRPRLDSKIPSSELEPNQFFARYQILRNISYAGPGCTVLFVVPRANEGLRDGVAYIESLFLQSTAVRCLALEDVLESLRSSVRSPALRHHLERVAEKYLLPEVDGSSSPGRNRE